MTKTIANLEQDHCKDDEIKFLEQMAESIPTNSYLRDLFSPKMVAWVKEQICNGFATNLYQFYKEEARDNETLNKMFVNARTMIKELEDKLETQKKAYESHITITNEEQNKRITELEGIVRGMFPLWIAAMSYAEHGRATDLDRIRNYYNGRDNPLTGEQLHYLFSIEDKK